MSAATQRAVVERLPSEQLAPAHLLGPNAVLTVPQLAKGIPSRLIRVTHKGSLVYLVRELITAGLLSPDEECGPLSGEDDPTEELCSLLAQACDIAMSRWVYQTLGGENLRHFDMCHLEMNVRIVRAEEECILFGPIAEGGGLLEKLDDCPVFGTLEVHTHDCAAIDYGRVVEALNRHTPGLGWNAYWALELGLSETLGVADLTWALEWVSNWDGGEDEEELVYNYSKCVAGQAPELLNRAQDIALLERVVESQKDADDAGIWTVATLCLKIIKAVDAFRQKEDRDHSTAEIPDGEYCGYAYTPTLLTTGDAGVVVQVFDQLADMLSNDGLDYYPIWRHGFSEHSQTWTLQRALTTFQEWFEIVVLCDRLADYIGGSKLIFGLETGRVYVR